MKLENNQIASHITAPTQVEPQNGKTHKPRPHIVAARAARQARRANH